MCSPFSLEMTMIIQDGSTTVFLALTAVTATGVLLSFKNTGIKLCQEKCTEHCKCLSIEYNIETLTCRLLEVEAKNAPEEGFIVQRKRKSDVSSLMSKGSRSCKACMQDRRCLVTRSGKETCVKSNHYLDTELNKQSAQNPTEKSEKARKTLLRAVESGNVQSVKNILDSGLADINAKSKDGMTPILTAARSGKRRVFELLMSKGADICAVHELVGTILHCAVHGGNFNILKLILRADKVDINRRNFLKVTPLELAHRTNQKRMMQLLKRNGGKFD